MYQTLKLSPRKFTCRILTRSKSWTNHNTFELTFENKSNQRPTRNILKIHPHHYPNKSNPFNTYIIKVNSPICTNTKVEYFNLFCYCITYSNIGLYHKISPFFDLLTTWILGDFHSDLLRSTPQHSVVFAMTILMMLHLLSYQQSPLQLLAVYILRFTPFSYCLPNHTGLYTWYILSNFILF